MIELEKSQLKINTKVLAQLTPTEFEVAKHLTGGLSEKEIAAEMFVSRDTIHTHTYNIRKKWNARCAVDIARKFILSLDDPKKYFPLLILLGIQFHIISPDLNMDWRTPSRVNTSVRTVRTSRKHND